VVEEVLVLLARVDLKQQHHLQLRLELLTPLL
jgi:hypothetical protein